MPKLKTSVPPGGIAKLAVLAVMVESPCAKKIISPIGLKSLTVGCVIPFAPGIGTVAVAFDTEIVKGFCGANALTLVLIRAAPVARERGHLWRFERAPCAMDRRLGPARRPPARARGRPLSLAPAQRANDHRYRAYRSSLCEIRSCAHPRVVFQVRFLIVTPAPGRVFGERARVTQHHQRVARRAEEVIALRDHFPVFSVVVAVFLEPIVQVLEDFELA